MVDPNTRQGKRTPVTLKIKFKSETLEQFIERYAVDVSQGGIFIRTKEPLAVGTQMKFEFQLRDASPLIAGEGTVVWTRENDPSRPAIAPGMGVRFDRLADGSQSVLERILSEKAKQSPSRPSEITKPPMFTDTPTRVAPAPVQDALLGRSPAGRARMDSFNETSNTPLPRPMPFHSDADDFDERAFEEATKVRSLDELAAQSAGLGGEETATNVLKAAPDSGRDDDMDLPTRGGPNKRIDATLSDPAVEPPPPVSLSEFDNVPTSAMIDRDSAPGLPSPPSAANRPPMMSDGAGSAVEAPRGGHDAAPSPLLSSPALLSPALTTEPAKTRLGMEPARVLTKERDAMASVPPPEKVPSVKDAPGRSSGRSGPAGPAGPAASKSEAERAPSNASAAASQRMPSTRRPSIAPVIIGIVVALAAIAAAVWFFVLRPPANDDVVKTTPGSATPIGSDVPMATPPKGSNGSAVVDNGSNGSAAVPAIGSDGSGSAGSATVTPPAAALVDTVIASNIEKATVVVVGGASGPSPFTAKLEKGKSYKVTITAPHYAPKTIEVKGGDPKVVAKLDAKPSTIHVESDPAGAQIFVDNAPTTVKTPGDITLTTAQAARKTIHITVRMAGKKPFDQILDPSSLTESGDKMTGTIDAGKLAIQVVVQRPNPPPNTGSGSAANGTNPGSDTTAPPPEDKPPVEKPPVEKPPTNGSGEPEPDWTKKN